MGDWKERVTEEREELNEKLQVLCRFLQEGAPGIEEKQKQLLFEQLEHMSGYQQVLDTRLSLGGEEN